MEGGSFVPPENGFGVGEGGAEGRFLIRQNLERLEVVQDGLLPIERERYQDASRKDRRPVADNAALLEEGLLFLALGLAPALLGRFAFNPKVVNRAGLAAFADQPPTAVIFGL